VYTIREWGANGVWLKLAIVTVVWAYRPSVSRFLQDAAIAGGKQSWILDCSQACSASS